jgi:hypothetical protein
VRVWVPRAAGVRLRVGEAPAHGEEPVEEGEGFGDVVGVDVAEGFGDLDGGGDLVGATLRDSPEVKAIASLAAASLAEVQRD